MDDGSAAAEVEAVELLTGCLISGVAALLYATGLCIQRAALIAADAGKTPPVGCRGGCCKKWQTINWLAGLFVYGVGGKPWSTHTAALVGAVAECPGGPTHFRTLPWNGLACLHPAQPLVLDIFLGPDLQRNRGPRYISHFQQLCRTVTV
eukprot:SAG11_NODE_1917_length_4070_cov_3.642156_3_plen_150_part_00